MIKSGEAIPAVMLKTLSDDGLKDISTTEFFANKRVVLFAVPGAFTPTCTARHLPGYVANYEAFKALRITLACFAVNDPFVMAEWSKAGHADDKVIMLPDGNASLTTALGVTMDGSGYGVGIRAQRCALYVDHGTVLHVAVEAPGKFDVSHAEAMLAVVTAMKAAA
jgi:glutaredoxin/glutathione-dependent peroxiredoxin